MAIPKFGQYTKNLPKGVHPASWAEVERAFGFNETRRALLIGLLEGCRALRAAGVSCLYLDGSFVTGKTKPNDYDACYSIRGVKGSLMDAVLLDFSDGRAAMKAKYKGEFFPAEERADHEGTPYLEFFQKVKGKRRLKGIIALDLGTLP